MSIPTYQGNVIPVMSLRPDWSAAIHWRQNYSTTITESLAGSEERQARQSRPLYALKFQTSPLSARETAYLRAILEAHDALPIACPLWPCATRLTAAAASGATSLALDDTASCLFEVFFEFAILWESFDLWEIVEMGAVTANGATLLATLANDYTTAAQLIPIAYGKIPRGDIDQVTDEHGRYQCEFDETFHRLHDQSRDEVPASCNAEAADWADVLVPANGGNVSAPTRQAACDLMSTIAAAGVRPKLLRMNLFAGDDFVHGTNTDMGAVQVPIIFDAGNALDVTSEAASTWNYQETGAGGGLQTSASSRLNTGLVPSASYGSITDFSCGVYVVSSSNHAGFAMLAQKAGAPFSSMGITAGPYSDGNVYGYGSDGSNTSAPNDPLGVGLYSVSRTSTTSKKWYKNGLSIATNTVDNSGESLPDLDFTIFCAHAGTPIYSAFTNKTLGLYWTGLGMNDAEMLALYNAIQTFETALTRNV